MATYKVEIFNKSELDKVFYVEAQTRTDAFHEAYSVARFIYQILNPKIKVYKQY